MPKVSKGTPISDLSPTMLRLNPELGKRPVIPAKITHEHLRVSTDEEKLNGWEREWLQSLRLKQRAGIIEWIGIQCFTFKLAHDLRYTPDLISTTGLGSITCWEIKGFKRPKNMQKLKVAARLFPMFRFVLVTKVDGQFTWEDVKI